MTNRCFKRFFPGAFVLERKLHPIKQPLHKSWFMFCINQRPRMDMWQLRWICDKHQAYDQIEWVFIEETLKKLEFFYTFFRL